MAFTTASLNTMLDQFVTAEGTLYVALFDTGLPSATGVEETGTNYARLPVTWGAASGGNKSNSAQVQFDNGGAVNWSNAEGWWGIYDALTAGNLLAEGALQASRDMSIANATLTFAIGDIDLTLT